MPDILRVYISFFSWLFDLKIVLCFGFTLFDEIQNDVKIVVDNGAPTQIYNGQSNGGKDNNNKGQNEIKHQYGYKQGNGYGNLNDQSPLQLPLPPPDGDYSSEGGWNFVREIKRNSDGVQNC